MALASAAGALGIPHNDDFAYRRAARSWFETGAIQLTGWSVMTLVGQLAVVQPVLWVTGGSTIAFPMTGAAFTGIAIVSGYSLARRLLSEFPAALAVLALLAVPGLLRNVPTFMTDIPAMALELLCLAVGAVAITRTSEGGRWRWLGAAMAVGIWGFSVREFAVAAPLAVLVAGLASDPRGRVRPYLISGAVLALACASIYLAVRDLPGYLPAPLDLTPASVHRVVAGTATLGFFVTGGLLVTLAAGWRDGWAGRALAGALVGAAVAVLLLWDDLVTAASGPRLEARLLIGTVFGLPGTPDAQVLAGARPTLIPEIPWRLLNIAAGLAAITGFGLVGASIATLRRPRHRGPLRSWRPGSLGSERGLLLAFMVIYGIGVALFGSVGSMFDRYLWPLVIPGTILLLASRPAPDADGGARRRTALVAATTWLLGTGVLSGAVLLNSLAFDAARWRMGEELVATGLAPMTIDAGFEWLGEHATDRADVTRPFPQNATRYSRLWSSYRQCAVVAASRLPWAGLDAPERRRGAYRMLLFFGPPRPLYVHVAPACLPVG